MRFDALLIGAGQANPPLARALVARGQKVALIEEHLLGGSCVNYGCTPSKTLIGSAHAIHTARRGAEFGFHAEEVHVDFARVMQRQRDAVQTSRGAMEKRYGNMDGLTLIRGHAEFTAPHTMRVGDQVVEAERIYLDVGARPNPPEIPGLNKIPYLTHQSLLDLTELPRHLIIVGGGYVGIEYAQVFRRFGSEVTVIQSAGQILPREDKDIADALTKVLKAEGIRLLLNAQVSSLKQRGDTIMARVDGHGGVSGSHVLLAVGVKPNSDRLGLDRAGIAVDDKGFIQVDDYLQTTLPGVYALGDVNGHGLFTHTSYNDYQIIEANLDQPKRKQSDRIPTYAVYTDPPLGRVGLSENEVKASGRPALKATLPMSSVARAREFGQTDGFMKVLIDAETQQILGAAVLGLTGDEVIHTFTMAMIAKAPYTAVRDAMFIHPTVNELLPTMLEKVEPI
jgi:pyruvate/2-oxoglutarate dehydrogenase complex dihydrolipoamide dehydrogenase (E3) component